MTVPAHTFDFQHPQFFVSKSAEITHLLQLIVEESYSATDPDFLMDYLELTAMLADLSDVAHFYSVLTMEQLLFRKTEVWNFIDRVGTLQHLVRDPSLDQHPDVQVQSEAVAITKKRRRSFDSEDTAIRPQKAMRDSKVEIDSFPAPNQEDALAESILTIEDSPVPWWMQPFCE